MVAEALKSLLAEAFDLVGVAEDGLALIEMAEQLRPDLIVADLTMPRLSGLDALARLRAAGNTTPMVILTMHRDASFARRALEAGASGYVLKHSAPAELTAALHAALAGKTYLTPQLVEAVAASMQASPQATDDPVAALTSRQREVLPLLAEGLAAKEIAARLGISARTVEFHKYQMMDTLGAHSNAELVRFAVKHRLIEL
ncbi:DNA-binding response regulator [Thiorhodovibrio winogradskyi]|nr:DNA-binding response regulator [Thiorhodovibrio winogradskyi]